jgi:ribosome-associated protein
MSKKISKSPSEQLCDAIVEGMQENKANEIVVLDLRELDGAISEFFVICSGDSDTHVDGISNSINRYVRKKNEGKALEH